MKYTKEALTFEQQADRLLNRGLDADRDELIKRLSSVSYYRLSGYLYPFRCPESDNYSPKMPNPKFFPQWHGEHKLSDNRSGIILMICRAWLRQISPTSQWHHRLEALFKEYPDISPVHLGLPEDWTQHPVWTGEALV